MHLGASAQPANSAPCYPLQRSSPAPASRGCPGGRALRGSAEGLQRHEVALFPQETWVTGRHTGQGLLASSGSLANSLKSLPQAPGSVKTVT